MENELRRVVDALPGLVWTALPDGRFDLLNRRWCEYTGMKLAEACDCGWQSAVHPDDLSSFVERWRSILASGQPGEIEARFRGFDKEYRRFLLRTVPVAMSMERSSAGTELVSLAMTKHSSANDLKIRSGRPWKS
jgi:PAS domain S-box-containing protein